MKKLTLASLLAVGSLVCLPVVQAQSFDTSIGYSFLRLGGSSGLNRGHSGSSTRFDVSSLDVRVDLGMAPHFVIVPASVPEQEPLVFAFADGTGTHLVTLPALDNKGNSLPAVPSVERLTKALCGGNRAEEVQFERHQNAGARDTGKQVSSNFSQLAGDIFRIQGGKTYGDNVCLLMPASYFSGVQMLPWQPGGPPAPGCSSDVATRLAAQYRRGVKQCSVLVRLGIEDFVAAEFQPKGDALLALEAIVSTNTLISHAESATCRGSSGWRVDDDCEFSPAALNPIFAWKRADGKIEIGLDWNGAEGDDLVLFRSDKNELESVVRAYRYHGS